MVQIITCRQYIAYQFCAILVYISTQKKFMGKSLLSMILPKSSLVSLTQVYFMLYYIDFLVISYYTCCENEV